MLGPRTSASRTITSLDGVWDFTIDTDNSGIDNEWFASPLPDARPMPVPASYNDITTEPAVHDHVGWAWYQRMVDVPRLVYTYMIGEDLPHPALTAARDALSGHYADELGEPFRTAGCCYYRDGRDSVAWHGDTIGRGATHDTMVAIVSVGDPRRLCLRPRGGGDSVAVEMGHGDLVVMGGSCQRTWEHAVPKVAAAGPRLSVQFRVKNVF